MNVSLNALDLNAILVISKQDSSVQILSLMTQPLQPLVITMTISPTMQMPVDTAMPSMEMDLTVSMTDPMKIQPNVSGYTMDAAATNMVKYPI